MISMSRWPCVPKPVPGWTRSSLMTRKAEADLLGVVIVGERKAVEGLQPAVVGVAALVTASDLVHGYLLMEEHDKVD